jgi:putative acetyltransferase
MMARARPNLALRPYLPADASLLAEIFRASIEELTGEDYSEAQQQAWASAADDEQAFAAQFASDLTLIATLDGSPVGFASLKGPDHIEMLYVHPALARQGVGSLLVDALEKLAAARGTERLTVDASDSASGFFDRRGYVAKSRNTVTCGDEWITNTTMEKRLANRVSHDT